MSDEQEYKRDAAGQFTELPAGLQDKKITTSERARELANKRWNDHRQEAANGVLAEIKEVHKVAPPATVAGAWGVLVGKLAKQIYTSDKPRGRDLVALGEIIGAIPSASDRIPEENLPGPDAGSILLDGMREQLETIFRDVLGKQRVQVVDLSNQDTYTQQVTRNDE